MNRILAILSAALLLAGCQALSLESGKLYHTGCASAVDTRSYSGGIYRDEYIHLKHSAAGLLVVDEWGDYNCAIKDLDMNARLEIQGSDIYLSFWVEPLANCFCPVEEAKYVVSGLESGKEYILHFKGLTPIQFKYSSGLNIKVKAENYMTN